LIINNYTTREIIHKKIINNYFIREIGMKKREEKKRVLKLKENLIREVN